MLSPDEHTCKNLLLYFLQKNQAHSQNGTGLERIADVLLRLTDNEPKLEAIGHNQLTSIKETKISIETKEETAPKYKRWARNIAPDTILLYTDGSNSSSGITSSACHCVRGPEIEALFSGQCQIGSRCGVEDGEIHAAWGRLTHLLENGVSNAKIYLCADNQNTLKALTGGPTAGSKYIKACLKDVKILRQESCKIKGK